jgi:hypothetical protein
MNAGRVTFNLGPARYVSGSLQLPDLTHIINLIGFCFLMISCGFIFEDDYEEIGNFLFPKRAGLTWPISEIL